MDFKKTILACGHTRKMQICKWGHFEEIKCIERMKTSDLVLLILFMRDNGRCNIPDECYGVWTFYRSE